MLPAAPAHLRSSCRQQRPALHRTARPLLHAGPDLDQSTDTGYCRRGAGRVAARVNGPTAAPAIRFGHAQQGICAATHQPAGRLTRLPSRRGVQRRSGRAPGSFSRLSTTHCARTTPCRICAFGNLRAVSRAEAPRQVARALGTGGGCPGVQIAMHTFGLKARCACDAPICRTSCTLLRDGSFGDVATAPVRWTISPTAKILADSRLTQPRPILATSPSHVCRVSGLTRQHALVGPPLMALRVPLRVQAERARLAAPVPKPCFVVYE
jgi:hypothetical protein